MESSSYESFRNPPPSCRPWPFFVLNDEYEPGMGEARITELLTNLARVGFGGIFIHPRPGLITEYLSPRWFELVRHCISESRRLGMVPALYDENSYPSGFAGGHVPDLLPETQLQYLLPRYGSWPDKPPRDALAIYLLKNGRPFELWDGTDRTEGGWMAFLMESGHKSAWHGGFAYTSLLHPDTTRLFLQTTHQRYREELGDELWSACAAFFTDEPHLPANAGGPWGSGIHFNETLRRAFLDRTGYRIESKLPDLYFNSETSEATRFDFYETMHHVWLENFARPMSDWCHEHGIPLTGHYLEHDWPCPYATPGHMHLLAHMDWPGSDLLDCFALDGHDYGDTQNLDPVGPGQEPHALYFLKQVQSVANQLGKKRVLNESWGAGGHDSTPLDWLRIGRYLAVHGVNLFVPHFSPTTIRGARKNDNPQFFSEHSACFELLKPMNDELGRLAWINLQGRSEQRILIVDSLTTGYCLAEKSDCLLTWPPDASLRQQIELMAATQRSVKPLRQSVSGFCQRLSDAQCDFDIGDEYILEESAKVDGNLLRVGDQAYELIVLPPGLRNLRSSTVRLLGDFVKQGGRVLGLDFEHSLKDGRVDDWPTEILVSSCQTPEELHSEILREIPPRLTSHPRFPSGVAHSRRVSDGASYYLIVNSSPETWSGELSVSESGAMSLWDPMSGRIETVPSSMTLSPGRAAVVVVHSNPPKTVPPPPAFTPSSCSTPTKFLSAKLVDANVLVLDTASVKVGSQQHPEQLVYEANRLYWDHHGLASNGWNCVIQFRDEILAKNKEMPSTSGGRVSYYLDIVSGTNLASIAVAFECPDQWRLLVNGTEITSNDAEPWLDCRIVKVPIGPLLTVGDNQIDLIASPFDVRQEVHQIYVLGDFAVTPSKKGFHLEPTVGVLSLGSWREQGFPFYDRKVRYLFSRPPGAGRICLHRSHWLGSVIEVNCGSLHVQSYGPEAELNVTAEEPIEFTVVVTGLPFNLFGPWHKPGLLPKHGWSNFWHGEDVPNEPQPGAKYRFLDLGLLRAPDWTES